MRINLGNMNKYWKTPRLIFIDFLFIYVMSTQIFYLVKHLDFLVIWIIYQYQNINQAKFQNCKTMALKKLCKRIVLHNKYLDYLPSNTSNVFRRSDNLVEAES